MQKAIVVVVALICFAAPVLLTLASYSSGDFSPTDDVAPRDLPGKVLFFTAGWCPACRRADPAYQELRNAGYPIRKVNVDSNSSLAQKYGIRSIPQFVYVVNGEEKRRVSGAASASRIKRLYRGGW
ncbi:thioredoxin family protein [Bremerella sp. T1]|uniref:thioredoxin family protein n=1 Tax=Bremerella sp. TYQ1 TaxID=3119568 RepID=UPI001CCFD905|nr:thioredoxin family protein [Bremerella volcania]UBM35794.1 thioredoxin family protein [Bremerella volcania]